MQQALASIEASLQNLHRTTLLQMLAPGVPASVTCAKLASIGLESSTEIEVLYQWHNGTLYDSTLTLADYWMFPFFYFSSLDDVATEYEALNVLDRWERGWLPIIADGGGDYLVVNVQAGVDDRGVYHFRNDFTECPCEYESLTDLFVTVAAAFQHGIFYVTDGQPEIQINFPRFYELGASLNPGISWWSDPSIA